MRLSTLCAAVLGTVFVVGLASALFAQAELAEAGLQVVPLDDPGRYNFAVSLHASAFAIALPLAAISLCLAIVSENRRSQFARVAAAVALTATPLAGGAMAVSTFTGSWVAYDTVQQIEMLMAILSLAAVVMMAVMVPRTRGAVAMFSTFSSFAMIAGLYYQFILGKMDPDSVLHDTYFALAAGHAFGLSIVLSTLAGLAAWAIQTTGQPRLWFSLLAGGAMLVSGAGAVLVTEALGLMGMPRRYADYPTSFAEPQLALALWSVMLAILIVAAMIWLGVSVAHRSPAPKPETAFD